MPANYLSGITGFVAIAAAGGGEMGASDYTFAKWSVSLKTNLPKVNNFSSAFQLLVAGLQDATIQLEGPYNEGNMPLTTGVQYDFFLGWVSGIYLSVPAFVESIDPDNDIDGAPRIKVTAKSSGSFTVSIM